MAELCFTDLTLENAFDFCAVLDAIGVDQILASLNFKEVADLKESGSPPEKIGAAVLAKLPGILAKSLPHARNEICAFFAGCMKWDNGSAVTADEVAQFKLPQFVRLLKEFVQKEDLADFLKAVSGLFGSGQQTSKT